MDNNHNISPKWVGFRKWWIGIAIALFLLLLFLYIFKISPWGEKCKVEPTIVEKVVEKEKLVDNPEHLARIAALEKENALIAGLQAKVKALEGVDLNFESPALMSRINLLETENAQITGLKSNIEDLTKTSGLVAGLQAKIKALEGVDLNFEPPALMSRINLLETENAQITGLKSNIEDLTKTSGLVAGLQAKVKALEAVDINFEPPALMNRIKSLESENAQIPDMAKRIVELETSNAKTNDARSAALTEQVNKLRDENRLIAGLKTDNSKLLQEINNLEVKTLVIPTLESRIESLQTEKPLFEKQIGELEAEVLSRSENQTLQVSRINYLERENGLLAGLRSQVSNLETDKNNLESDKTKLRQTINNLEVKTLAIPTLESRLETLQAEKPVFEKRIGELEGEVSTRSENQTLQAGRINYLERENGLLAGLRSQVSNLETDKNNLESDKTKLRQTINNLEVKTLAIPTLESRLETLQAEKPVFEKRIGELEGEVSTRSANQTLQLSRINYLERENGLLAGLRSKVSDYETKQPTYISKIATLEKENSLIPGLKAKVSALEAIDVNFTKPVDNSGLKQKINNLEIQTLKIPNLESRIAELKTENSLIPGLKAKVKALEAIDINFINNDSGSSNSSAMSVPDVAKLYFDSGSSRFPTDAKQSMADVVVYLRTNPNSRVSLIGFHDAAGNASWNRRLANKRSGRVRQILIDAGISTDRISVLKPSKTLGTGTPEEARRVEVTVSN